LGYARSAFGEVKTQYRTAMTFQHLGIARSLRGNELTEREGALRDFEVDG
jgi:hypothetical protein